MDVAALDFVNSEEWYGRTPEHRVDHLWSPGWIEAFLAKWSLGDPGPPMPRDRAELTDLRALLRRLVTAVAANTPLSRRDLQELDRALSAATVRRRVGSTADGVAVDLVPERTDWRWVRSEIAASFAHLLEHGEWERIKVCSNEECAWAFYDESKNRRRRWCGASCCGDLDKVRRFRERQRAVTGARTASARR
jgi:predicted RNA-binding Zn ribbon-like protein